MRYDKNVFLWFLFVTKKSSDERETIRADSSVFCDLIMLSNEKIKLVLKALRDAYPDAKPQLEFRTPFELLIATMLSAQCTDKQVNKCTRVLFDICRTPAAFVALGSSKALEPYIKGCGLYQTKAKNIIATCQILVDCYQGEVPASMEELVKLPGVGRKTANVVLSNAFHIPAIAVDTHVFRVSNRIGLAQANDVRKTEDHLMQNIPSEYWSDAHHWLIYHGRQVCTARKPKCEICPIKELCESRQ